MRDEHSRSLDSGRLLHVAPSVERHSSRVELQFTSILNNDIRSAGPKIKVCAYSSAGHRKNWRRICGR